jgi:hypothetical protein
MDISKEEASTAGTAEATVEANASNRPIGHGQSSTNASQSKADNYSEAAEFLTKLRSPPWLLIAIDPEKDDKGRTKITALSVYGLDAALRFIKTWDGKRNLYYSVNPTNEGINKKPTKKDITAIEFLPGDLDPREGELPEDAKMRYLDQLNGSFQPKPTVVMDSGNGIQCLWKLAPPILLGENRDSVIADAEARSKALMERLGSKAGTQNIDRILRIPGTTNLPTEAKKREGRSPCLARLIDFNNVSYLLNSFPLPNGVGEENRPGTPDDDGHHARQQQDEEEQDRLEWTIRTGGDYREITKRSHGVWYVVNEMLRQGYLSSTIVSTLLDTNNKISDHIYDQQDPSGYAKKQVDSAKKAITLDKNEKDVPYQSQANIRIALLKLGVTLRYDQFADHALISGLADFGPVMDDAAFDRIWLVMAQRFKLHVSKDFLKTIVTDMARRNKFHPVRDYLDAQRWDGVGRIDTWLTIYGGVEDNEYTRAVGALVLVAAVRRVRQPGCKFDEMLVLEQEVQGTDKSTALAILAVREEWFSDDLPLNVSSKEVIETTQGRWIIEAGEMSGMKRTDVGHLKALLSRQVDRARLAYGHFTSEVPRQCIFFGTINDLEYLRDTTGNRRFWPVRCQRFDIAALQRDRDQLWAEAAMREASGVSIRLPPALWSMAAAQQASRLTADPWKEALIEAGLEEMSGKISMGAVWTILDVRGGQQGQDQSKRVGEAMRCLGWHRANSGGTVKISGKLVSGFVKGEKPWQTVMAWRDKDGRLDVSYV